MLDFGARRDLPTVLLIDDDHISREVTATLLTMSGYTVHTATGGEPSLELLGAGEVKPGVILMDAQMPGLSGTRLIKELRAHSQARLIAISGSGASEEVAAAADGFLLKPFSVGALETLLKELEARAVSIPAAGVSRNRGARKSGFASRSGSGAPVLTGAGQPATKRVLRHSGPLPPRYPSSPATASPAKRPNFLDPNQPVVSVETLAQFRGLMPKSAVREIYVAIVADLAKRLDALEAAIANGNGDEIRRIGHSIKGGCGMAGALEAARLGAKLEETAAGPENSQLDNSARLLGDLRNAARNLERMLEGELPA